MTLENIYGTIFGNLNLVTYETWVFEMRLSEERVEVIAVQIVDELEKGGFIEYNGDRQEFIYLVEDTILDDLEIEDRLDEEIRSLLRNYENEMDRQNIPYHQMFKMIKSKLIKERNLIL